MWHRLRGLRENLSYEWVCCTPYLQPSATLNDAPQEGRLLGCFCARDVRRKMDSSRLPRCFAVRRMDRDILGDKTTSGFTSARSVKCKLFAHKRLTSRCRSIVIFCHAASSAWAEWQWQMQTAMHHPSCKNPLVHHGMLWFSAPLHYPMDIAWQPAFALAPRHAWQGVETLPESCTSSAVHRTYRALEHLYSGNKKTIVLYILWSAFWLCFWMSFSFLTSSISESCNCITIFSAHFPQVFDSILSLCVFLWV